MPPLRPTVPPCATAERLGLQPIGAIDAHVTGQIGKYVTYLLEKVETLKDFIEEL